jgi:IS605 OrfB family transposase
MSLINYWTPLLFDISSNIDTHSWFDIKVIHNPNPSNVTTYIDSNNETIMRSVKVECFPTSSQKNILHKWFHQCVDIYNASNNYIKKQIYDISGNLLIDQFNKINFINIRDIYLKKFKTKICSKTNDTSYNKTILPAHIFDEAIKSNVTMYKSAVSNWKNYIKKFKYKTKLGLKPKPIKSFRLRNLQHSKRHFNLTIEEGYFSKVKNGFVVDKLGIMKCNYDLKTIDHTCIFQYDTLYKKYYLFVPTTIKKVDNRSDIYLNQLICSNIKDNIDETSVNYIINTPMSTLKNTINKITNNSSNRLKQRATCGIDPGIRTFLTVYSKNETYEIGTNTSLMLEKYYDRIDKLNHRYKNKKCTKKKYKKAITHYYDKIKNRISDLHWKASNFLCKKFDKIKIGKISTSSIVSNEKSDIPKIAKRRLYSLSHYRFREKLTIQCEKFNVSYKEINEYNTSKMCSTCKNIKEDLGKCKIYECLMCGKKIDRDINASLNIYMKKAEK